MLNTGQHIKVITFTTEIIGNGFTNTHRLRNTMSTPPLNSIDWVLATKFTTIRSPIIGSIGRATPHKIKLDLL